VRMLCGSLLVIVIMVMGFIEFPMQHHQTFMSIIHLKGSAIADLKKAAGRL